MYIETAEAWSLLFLHINSQLNDSVAVVRDKCSAEDLHWYRRGAGKIIGGLQLYIQGRLWAEHPSLRPHEMDGEYVVDPSNFEPRFYRCTE